MPSRQALATTTGRAAQRAPVYRKSWKTPIKKGRSHDIQPAFHGISVQHSRWFRQLRRLQSYHRWASSSKVSQCPGDQGVALWKSILEVTGFQPSFASWWISRTYHCPDDVMVIPEFPPLPDVALKIYHAFLTEVRSLEQKLQQAQRASAKHRREVDPNLIFKDIRRPPALPVETLVENATTRVVHVDADQSAFGIGPTLSI